MPRAKFKPEVWEKLKEPPYARKRPGGSPEWDPSEETRAMVMRWAGIGVPHENIAKLLDVSIHTLRKWCMHELELGVAQARALILNKAFTLIMDGSEKMLLFYLATRMGWVIPKDGASAAPEDLGTMSDADIRAELDAISSRARVATQARGLAPPL